MNLNVDGSERVDGDRDLTLEAREAVGLLVGLFLLGMGTRASAMVLPVPEVIVAPLVVLGLTLVPGSLILISVVDSLIVEARTLVYAAGLSLMVHLATGLVLNLALPAFLGPPLRFPPLAIAATLVVSVLASIALRYGGRIDVTVPPLFTPAPLALALLPLGSVLAANYLNVAEENLPLLLVLVAVALTPIALIRFVEERWYAFGIWTMSLAILYHKTMLVTTGFSGSPTVTNSWFIGRWVPLRGSADAVATSLLPNAVLFPAYARLAGVDILTEVEIINPLFVSLIPVALFVTFRRYVGAREAVLGASLFTFCHPFYIQYPTAGRAATPVIFLSMIGLLISDREVPKPVGAGLAVVFVLGLVVSHYGTSYYVMTAFIGAIGILVGFHVTDEWLDKWTAEPVRGDGAGERITVKRLQRFSVFNWRLVGLQAVAAFGWYMYTAGGKWQIVPKHIESSYESLVSGGIASGRTGARVTRDYGSLSISLAKVIYVTLAVLMLLGLAVAFYRRYVAPDERQFDDRYLAVATVMLGLFGFTLVARNWGGGRPMMITFSFTAIFAVVGASGVVGLLRRQWDRLRGRPVSRESNVLRSWIGGLRPRQWRGASNALVAVFLVSLFVLNSGVVAAVTTQDRAPSNALANEWIGESSDPHTRAGAYRESSIQAHTWIVTYYGYRGESSPTRNVYGDYITFGHTDWLRPHYYLRSGGQGYGPWKPRGELASLAEPGLEPGYVLLLGHNTALETVAGYLSENETAYDAIVDESNRRDIIYTGGYTRIYYYEPDRTRKQG